MSLTISRFVGAHLAAVGLLLSAVSVFAQEAPPNAPVRPRADRPLQRVIANRQIDQPARSADRDIAEWLGICNQEEVAISKLAASKAKSKNVKQFSEMLAKEHGQLTAQLEKFGAQMVAFDAGFDAARQAGAPRPPAARQAEAPRAPNPPGAPAATQTRTTAAIQG